MAGYFGMAGPVINRFLDFTATGRTLVQAAFGADRNATLTTLFIEQFLAALAAEDHVAIAVHGHAAAQDGAFVLLTNRTYLCTGFADVPLFLDVAAQAAQRDLEL
jgi:hypothetical protein